MHVAWHRWLVLLVLGFAWAAPVFADLSVRFGAEHFRWREYDDGARLLEETGPRFRIGAELQQPIGADRRTYAELSGSVYLGVVDYDGQACSLTPGSCVPFQSDARYTGVQGQGLLVHRFGEGSGIEVFGGGGIDYWHRDIKGRDGVSGAVEDWNVFYALAGGGVYLRSGSLRHNLRAGVKYPFYTFEVPDSYDVTLEPKGRLSFFTRFTTDFYAGDRPRWGFGVYYDSYRFDTSDKETDGAVQVWQPESRQDLIGVYGTIYLQ